MTYTNPKKCARLFNKTKLGSSTGAADSRLFNLVDEALACPSFVTTHCQKHALAKYNFLYNRLRVGFSLRSGREYLTVSSLRVVRMVVA